MSFTGLIFGAVAAFWLVYLIPLILNRKDNGLMDEIEPGEPFSASVTIVRRGTPLESAENGTAVISTPLNRRAALRELSEIDREAARRRRVVLVFLTIVTSVVGALAGFGLVSWWTIAAPLGLIAVFLGIARFSVAHMRRGLDARARVIRGGDGVDEQTVAIDVLEDDDDSEHELSVELTAPVEHTGSLWDPIPITAPTYVNDPLTPPPVRPIALPAPVPVGSAAPAPPPLPRVAPPAAPSDEQRRAVGE